MASMLYVFVLCFLCTSHLVQAKGCHSGLGMQDGSISDKQLSVSSAVNDLASARKGRLYSDSGYGAWCPLQKDWYAPGAQGPFYDQYYQVSFSRPVRIIAVGTQGRAKNFGMEGVDNFFVKYSVMQKNWKEYHEWGQKQPKRFFGNKYKMNVTKMNYFKPPFIADTFRLIPEIYPVNQVCLRMELYGCHLQQDLISYTMKPGDIYGSRYNLTDLIFDGIVNSTIMYSGMGFLTDGLLASKDFLENEGYGWIGWYSGHTPSPYIVFTFFKRRVFRSLTFHCNVRDRSGIKLFKSVKVSFSAEDQSSHGFVVHDTNQASSGYKWMNYNVTIDLCENYGNQVKVEFKYDGEWILISEIMFDSNPLPKGIFPPTPKCKPTTQPPITDELLVNTTTTSNISVITSKDGRVTGDGLDDGAIVGIVCGVVFVVLLVVVFLCYWCFCRRTQNQRKPSFYHFIRWELKPYNSYRDTVRISRLGSNGEKTSTFRRDQNGETQNPESAIYASIKNLEEIGLVPDNTIIQAKKPGKPKNRPPPLPINAFPHKNDEHYALPDSPLIPEQPAMDEDGYCSPEPQSPLISPPISPIPQIPSASPTTPDVCYAEPEAPRPQTGGYSEPIDAVIPGDGIFRNPVYEEIYSEPYQGVSGSTLYATPSTVVRHETFKDLPRDKIVFKEKIGDGQFGEVHLGEVDGGLLDEDTTKQVLVAIKKLKPEVDKNIKDDFFKEVKIMSGIQHENVIRLLGVCRDDPMCMVVEYMVNGDLNQFLKERELSPGTKGNKEKVLTYQALIYMASQVAAGMKYISSLKFVHRDLATRNCLVGHSYTVKIADFGMSRHLYTKHYYRVHGRVILPIRWMAPECILQGKFTSESDVWAFAVTLWEILTLATEYPYNDLTDEQVIENIQRMFFRPSCPKIVYLSKPSVCPDDVYDMMKACWQRDPDARPDFNDLHGFVKSKVRMSEMAI